MRLLGPASLLLIAAIPTAALSADESVTVLRGASAPPPAAEPAPVVVQAVAYPPIVYVPSYYPTYAFYYPGFVTHSRPPVRLPHGHK